MSLREAPPQTVNFLPCTLQILLPRMSAGLFALWDNPMDICINQDVPTYFHAVQRSRLPMIALPLDRGLSDTNVDEVNQHNSTKNTNKSKIFGSYCCSGLLCFRVAQIQLDHAVILTSLRHNSFRIHPTLLKVRRGASAVPAKFSISPP
ncbi:hypothetical protein [Calothrix sp. PCC 6303]|uniref:hypothetical protein n=1 Tax=Calothrix sp. PCC 6303 TaxID=1170562 RepID=UPI001181B60A|nr:hypothetical protein [Calothrix sp. PCC 6303]